MKTLVSAALIVVSAAGLLFAKGGPPINDVCPIDNKTVRVIYRIFTDEGTIAFCCVDCMEAYQKNPGRYPVTKKKE